MEDSSQRLSWNSLLGRQICWEHHALVAPLDNPCFLSFSFHWYYVFLTPSQHLLPREPGLYQTAVYSVHHTMGHPFGLDSAAMARRSFTSCSSMLQQAGWTCSLAHWQLERIPRQKVEDPLKSLGSKRPQHHFCHSLPAKLNHKSRSDSGGRETTSWSEELQNHTETGRMKCSQESLHLVKPYQNKLLHQIKWGKPCQNCGRHQ